MNSCRSHLALYLSAFALAVPAPLLGQEIDFGDDTGRYAKDGECDDKRFAGTGMTRTVLLDADILRDASDCKAAFDSGTLRLRGIKTRLSIEEIAWGDDSGTWANDNECDDARFSGNDMAESLSINGIGKDASDCRAAYRDARIDYRALFIKPPSDKLIDYGDDASEYAQNDQCDDVRFTGDYAAEMIYISEDIGHDATDCQTALENGSAVWQADKIPMNLGAEASADDIEDAAEEAVEN